MIDKQKKDIKEYRFTLMIKQCVDTLEGLSSKLATETADPMYDSDLELVILELEKQADSLTKMID